MAHVRRASAAPGRIAEPGPYAAGVTDTGPATNGTRRPATEPPVPADSSLPSRGARAVAFLSILVAGTCGGLIGWAITDLQCEGDCTAATGLGGLVGALIGAGGVAVIAVLGLRAMAEWKAIERQRRRGMPPG